jgi:hypothetical protein
MENSDKKPKKSIFSFFCCFSVGKDKRQRKNQKMTTKNSLTGNKTNISDNNSSLKIKDFTNTDDIKGVINEKIDNSNIINKDSNNKIHEESKNNINDSDKKMEEQKIIKCINMVKCNTMNNIAHIKTFEDKTDKKSELCILNSNNNHYDKKRSLNEQKLTNKNRVLYLYNDDYTEKNKSSKDSITIKESEHNLYDQVYDMAKNVSIIEKNKENLNLNNQENEDNVNIYDNNNSSFIQLKINDINEMYNKNKTFNDKELNIKNNINNGTGKKNSSFSYHKNNNIEKDDIKKSSNNELNDIKDDKVQKEKKIIELKNSDIFNVLHLTPKKIKLSKSSKVIKTKKLFIQELSPLNKAGRFSLINLPKNKLNFKILDNTKIDKEQTIPLNYFNFPSNKKNNKIELNYINNNNEELLHKNKEHEIKEEAIVDDKIKKELPIENIAVKEEKEIIDKKTDDIIKSNNKNLNEEEQKIKEAEENIKNFEGEIEDENIDIEEQNPKINDTKSMISNYVIAPLIPGGAQELRSYAPSLFSKSEFKDNISNLHELIGNKIGHFNIIQGGNDTEIEIMNENDKDFKSFIETPRASGTYNKRFAHKSVNQNNINKTNSKSINSYNQSMLNICHKINSCTSEIQKINERLKKVDSKMKDYEKINKQYETWIEKEEEERIMLEEMLNFLNEQKRK